MTPQITAAEVERAVENAQRLLDMDDELRGAVPSATLLICRALLSVAENAASYRYLRTDRESYHDGKPFIGICHRQMLGSAVV